MYLLFCEHAHSFREKRKRQDESDSESDDPAVAARIRRAVLPKPSVLTMGMPTPFVTPAAAAAINLCNALHPSAFQPHFRAQVERDRWKRQVASRRYRRHASQRKRQALGRPSPAAPP